MDDSHVRPAGVSVRWNTSTQTPHGGQEWRDLSYFVSDFSVTTNCLGTPQDALQAAVAALQEASHYPSSDQEPALSRVAAFLFGGIAMESAAAGASGCEPYKHSHQQITTNQQQQAVVQEDGELEQQHHHHHRHVDAEIIEQLLDGNGVDKLSQQDDEREGGNNEAKQQHELQWKKNPQSEQHAKNEQQGVQHNSQNTAATWSSLRARLLLGNGASELIDLCVRTAGATTWMPGISDVQYKEYERSADNYGLKRATGPKTDLLCVVNPCNPTGDFLDIEDLKKLIEERAADDASVLVDESMLPWYGHDWRSQSLVSQGGGTQLWKTDIFCCPADTWIRNMYAQRGVRVFVIHSWTKLWACPGVRCGSVLAPTSKEAAYLRKYQVPWSVNAVAISFLYKVVEDVAYLEKTWKVTTKWNREFRIQLKNLQPGWDIFGETWLPFIWIDTKSARVAQFYVSLCMKAGVPIRWGAHGYQRPTHIRVAVRHPAVSSIVLNAFKTPCPIVE